MDDVPRIRIFELIVESVFNVAKRGGTSDFVTPAVSSYYQKSNIYSKLNTMFLFFLYLFNFCFNFLIRFCVERFAFSMCLHPRLK